MNSYCVLMSEKISFIGSTKKIKKYKSIVESKLNEVGIIVNQTYGSYTIKYKTKNITVPKLWVKIL